MQLEKGASELTDRIARTQAEILARTLSALATDPKPDVFLGQVLSVLVEHCGAQGGGLWLDDPQSSEDGRSFEHVYQMYALEGRTLLQRRVAHPADRIMFSVTRANVQQMQRGSVVRHGWRDIMENEAYGPHREFLVGEGTRHVAYVPLFFGRDYRGFITLRFGSGEALKPDDEPFATALANQAVVSLELSRATAKAREAEISKQNQVAAEERAAELGRVNLVLHSAVSGLQNLESFEAFVRQTLGAAAEITGAKDSALVLVPGNSRTLVVQHVVRDGVWIDVEREPDYVSWHEANTADPANIADLFDKVFSGPEVWWATADDPLLPPRQREFHRRQGHASIAYIPLQQDGRPLGFMGLSFRHRERPLASRLELARVLAHQFTLAYEFRRLGDQSRIASALREQAAAEARELEVSRQNQVAAEEQVAELMRVNAALSSAISGLVNLDGLETFVDQTLEAATEIVGAAVAVLFLVDADGRRMIMQQAWADRRRIDLANDLDFASYRASERGDTVGEMSRWARLFMQPENWWVTVDDPAMLEQSRRFHKSRGHVSAALVPLWRNGDPLGFIGLGFKKEGRPPQAKLELVRVLAEQLTLAFELRRLGAESRDAAVARERAATEARDLEVSRQNQLAAENRVAELVRVNAALSSALQGLQRLEGFEAFLHSTLTATASVFGAVGATLFLADRDRRRMVVEYGVKNGEPVDVATDPDYAPWHGPDRADTPDDLAFWKWAFRNPRYSWTKVSDPLMPALARRLARRRGQVSVTVVPLWQAGRPLGFIGLGFLKPGSPVQTQLELVRVVAQQVALAYEFTRLGAEEREAAVARERELAVVSRITQLEMANAALARSTAELSVCNDVHAYAGSLLRTFLQDLPSAAGSLWLLQPDGSRRLAVRATKRAVKLFALRKPCTDRGVRTKAALLDIIEDECPQRRRSSWMAEDIATTPALDGRDSDRARLMSAGIRALLDVPVVVNTQYYGSLMVCLATPHNWTAEQIELLKAQANQAALAMEMRRLGELARQNAIAEERNRFAREVHDTLAQDFLAIAAHLQSARRKLAVSDLLPAKAGPIAAALDIALGTAQDGLVEARRSVWALVPRVLEKGGSLAVALRAVVDRIAPDRAAVCETGSPCALSVEVVGELLGIAREALSNAARHAGPHARINVRIRHEAGATHVSVEDDGAGCDLAATENPRAGHFGLWTMRERAARIGGQLEVRSVAGQGTCVAICVPWGL